jgi:hypothetical protein
VASNPSECNNNHFSDWSKTLFVRNKGFSKTKLSQSKGIEKPFVRIRGFSKSRLSQNKDIQKPFVRIRGFLKTAFVRSIGYSLLWTVGCNDLAVVSARKTA